MPPIIRMESKRFGRWLVLSERGRTKQGTVMWRCRCDCGNKKTISGTVLRQGLSRSCGCLCRESCVRNGKAHFKHGLMGTPAYQSWIAMKSRCYNPKAFGYKDYGARGITVCQRWRNKQDGFQNFLRDMGPRPAGHTLDRKKVNGNYEPDNCRWATAKQQQNNRRCTQPAPYNDDGYLAHESAAA